MGCGSGRLLGGGVVGGGRPIFCHFPRFVGLTGLVFDPLFAFFRYCGLVRPISWHFPRFVGRPGLVFDPLFAFFAIVGRVG